MSVVQANAWRITRGLLLFTLVAGLLFWVHWKAHASLEDTATALVWAIAGCAVYYFLAIRPDWPDDRIRYTILLWAALWLFISALLALLAWASPYVNFNAREINGETFSQYVNTFAQIAGIIIAATMVVVSNRHNAKEADETARQQIYQLLELESIKLFRFECDQTELVHLLWFTDAEVVAALKRASEVDDDDDEQVEEPKAPLDVRIKNYQLKQYTCQILNLFEMACRFRKQGIIEPEVFGSWVIWMWELCAEPMFQLQWHAKKDGIEYNYVADLREIINAGIYYATEDLPSGVKKSGRKRSFYQFVAHVMFAASEEEQAKLVQTWLEDSAPNVKKLKRLEQRHAKFYKFWFRENNNAQVSAG